MLFKLPRFTTLVLFPIILCSGLIYLLSFVEGNWICDICAQTRLLLLAPLGFALIFSLLRNNAAIAFCSTVLVSIICVQTIFGSGHSLDKSAKPNIKENNAKQITVLNFNTEFQHNNKIESLIAYCKKNKPDIVVLSESTKDWLDALQVLEYPSTMSVLKSPGITVFSNYPVIGSQIYYSGGSKHPQIHVQVDKDQQTINIVALHLSAMQTQAGYDARKKELKAINEQLKKMPYPTIVLGDTNSSNWSPSIKTFLQDTDLKDTQEGFMTIPTWPARTGKLIENLWIPPFVAIDNIFVSKDFDVLERKVGPPLGSDHLPIMVKLQLQENTNKKISL